MAGMKRASGIGLGLAGGAGIVGLSCWVFGLWAGVVIAALAFLTGVVAALIAAGMPR